MTRRSILLSRQELSRGVDRLAAELARDYREKNPLLLGVLKGSFIFLSDLVRRLDFPVEVDFLQLSSYGSGTQSSGRVRMVRGLSRPIKGREVVVVEDIVDTGITLAFLLRYLLRRHPNSLRLCALLDKPERRQVPVAIDYLGFSVPNRFLVGYGLDWNERFRHLPEVWALEEK